MTAIPAAKVQRVAYSTPWGRFCFISTAEYLGPEDSLKQVPYLLEIAKEDFLELTADDWIVGIGDRRTLEEADDGVLEKPEHNVRVRVRDGWTIPPAYGDTIPYPLF